jgi:hypothetical protein
VSAPPDEAAYAYLLGIYLGDGRIVTSSPRSSRLSIHCDIAYPRIIEEIEAAIGKCAPGCRIRESRKSRGCLVAIASSPLGPLAFPQHGPGRKHERPIELEGWQREITHRRPEALLRGLIHSDGARCINRFRTKLPSGGIAEYEYPRHFFSNLSADIRAIFCEHCELVGIR